MQAWPRVRHAVSTSPSFWQGSSERGVLFQRKKCSGAGEGAKMEWTEEIRAREAARLPLQYLLLL